MKNGPSLRPLAQCPSQATLTNALQVADILEWILLQTGPAEIWQTSFSISEEFIRRLHFIRKKHNVKSLTLVLDHKATNKTLRLWQFISNVFDSTYLADNHSKILIVEGAEMKVAVITSQNLTRGNRYESSLITTDPEVYGPLLSEIKSLIRLHSVPLDELLGRKLAAD